MCFEVWECYREQRVVEDVHMCVKLLPYPCKKCLPYNSWGLASKLSVVVGWSYFSAHVAATLGELEPFLSPILKAWLMNFHVRDMDSLGEMHSRLSSRSNIFGDDDPWSYFSIFLYILISLSITWCGLSCYTAWSLLIQNLVVCILRKAALMNSGTFGVYVSWYIWAWVFIDRFWK